MAPAMPLMRLGSPEPWPWYLTAKGPRRIQPQFWVLILRIVLQLRLALVVSPVLIKAHMVPHLRG